MPSAYTEHGEFVACMLLATQLYHYYYYYYYYYYC